MIFRALLGVLLAAALASCMTPYKKKDAEEKKPLKDQTGDQTFQAFVGRLRIAVAKRDRAVLSSMMTGDFGYRWDTPEPGESIFQYWDLHGLWPVLDATLRAKFVPNECHGRAAASRHRPELPRLSRRAADRRRQVEIRVFRPGGKRAVKLPADPVALGLPHRAPFIFVDEVCALTPGESALCRKTFAADEPFFRGHFPGDPLVPGVLLAEALAQTAGLAAGHAGRGFRLTAIKGMKFCARSGRAKNSRSPRIAPRSPAACGTLK